jgi:hypothetical protein
MSVSLTSPITGGAQTGFTSPTYTVVADMPPNANTGKQWYCSALGGTQSGVRAHSISDPFTITFEKPSMLKTLQGLISAVTGLYGKVPENVYKGIFVRKGVNIAANNLPRVMEVDCRIRIPAGADNYDAANIRAAISATVGALNQISAGLGDTCVTGTLG